MVLPQSAALTISQPLMKIALVFPFLVLFSLVAAEDLGRLIFKDDFSRHESQEKIDEPGNGWATNSKSRAKGNKQVDLRDGALHIFIHAEADHAVSVTRPAEFTDGAVSLRFMLQDERDSLGLNFADQIGRASCRGRGGARGGRATVSR